MRRHVVVERARFAAAEQVRVERLDAVGGAAHGLDRLDERKLEDRVRHLLVREAAVVEPAHEHLEISPFPATRVALARRRNLHDGALVARPQIRLVHSLLRALLFNTFLEYVGSQRSPPMNNKEMPEEECVYNKDFTESFILGDPSRRTKTGGDSAGGLVSLSLVDGVVAQALPERGRRVDKSRRHGKPRQHQQRARLPRRQHQQRARRQKHRQTFDVPYM